MSINCAKHSIWQLVLAKVSQTISLTRSSLLFPLPVFPEFSCTVLRGVPPPPFFCVFDVLHFFLGGCLNVISLVSYQNLSFYSDDFKLQELFLVPLRLLSLYPQSLSPLISRTVLIIISFLLKIMHFFL